MLLRGAQRPDCSSVASVATARKLARLDALRVCRKQQYRSYGVNRVHRFNWATAWIRRGLGSAFRRMVCHAENRNRVREQRIARQPGDLRASECVSLHGVFHSEKIRKNWDIPRALCHPAVEKGKNWRAVYDLTPCDKGDNLCSDVTTEEVQDADGIKRGQSAVLQSDQGGESWERSHSN